jgi:uncharacterized protein YciI
MSCYAVIREAGRSWIAGGIDAQPRLGEHAAFMNDLAEAAFVVLAGPLAGSESGRLRALLIVRAAGEDEIEQRLANDPWADRLAITSIEPWTLFVGAAETAARTA